MLLWSCAATAGTALQGSIPLTTRLWAVCRPSGSSRRTADREDAMRITLARIGRWVLPVLIVVEVVLLLSGLIDVGQGLRLALLVELSLAGLVPLELWVIVTAVRRARRRDEDLPEALASALGKVLPRRLARFAVHDFMLVRALWMGARRTIDARAEEIPIRYGRDMLLMLWVVLVIDSVLVVLLHVALPWDWPRRALLLLGIAGFVWLLGFICTLYVYPHTAGSDRLRLRFAAMRDYTVPLRAVASVDVEPRTWDIPGTVAIVGDALILPVQNLTNVSLALGEDVEVRTPRHRTPVAVRTVRFAADDPVGAQRLIAGVMARR